MIRKLKKGGFAMSDEFNRENQGTDNVSVNETRETKSSDQASQNDTTNGSVDNSNSGYRAYESAQNNTGTYNSASGNGSYDYNRNNNSSTEYHSGYSNSYGSNNYSGNSGSYSGNYSSGYTGSGYTGGGNNTQGTGGGKKRGGKALFAILLAVIFGVCAGAGAYGISRISGSGSNETAEAREDSSKDNAIEEKTDNGSSDNAEESAESEEAVQDPESDSSDNVIELDLQDGNAVRTQVTQVASDVMPAIVSVYNSYTQQTQDFFGQTYQQQGESTGSGIIIADEGDELLIATNNHVVANADSLEVQFIDQTTAKAELKGTDSTNDLAVIAVKESDLDKDTLNAINIAKLGNSDKLVIGEPVVAIGNALGYGQSVTTGVVSALNREMTTEDGETGVFIQTDAAINPGNSGGALVDLNGYVIGINSNKIGGDTVEGMGYSIPMSKAEPIIKELASQETKLKVDEDKQGRLGIRGVSVTSQVSSAYGMPEGVYVAETIEGTGAAQSDIQKGDIITKINGTTVEDMTDLQKQLTYYEAGKEVTLTVERPAGNNEYDEKEIKVTLSDKSKIEEAEAAQDSNGQSSQKGQTPDTETPDEQDPSSSQQMPGSQSGSSQSGYYQFPWNQFFGN